MVDSTKRGTNAQCSKQRTVKRSTLRKSNAWHIHERKGWLKKKTENLVWTCQLKQLKTKLKIVNIFDPYHDSDFHAEFGNEQGICAVVPKPQANFWN